MKHTLIILVSFIILPLSFVYQVSGLSFFDADDIDQIELNEIKSIIVKTPIETRRLRQAVSDFNALWTFRVGYLLEIKKQHFGKLRGVYLRQSNLLKSKKNGSFLLHKKGKGIIVDSCDEEGLANALYYLAHNMLGARWYWPTKLGFEWVDVISESWEIPREIIEPSFEMRSLYGSDIEYSIRNRLVGGYSFNHNLANVFKPEIQAIYPDIFADLGDRVMIFKGSTIYDPQPNLTHKGAIELISLAAIDFFKKSSSQKFFFISQ